MGIFKKDKRLGSAGKRRYDIPLNKNEGADFLILLIALMTFLAVMAMAGSFALSAMTKRWSSGLENKLTIEVPAEKSDGTLRTAEQIDGFSQKVIDALKDNPSVKAFEKLDEADIQELVSPWLGDDMVLEDIPLPGLISVDLHISTPEIIEFLKKDMALINDNIRIDTHETWLMSILRVTGTLQFSAGIITAIIALTTIVAVAGGVRARMAIHREDVELLHLMGASDNYITKQFQRHALVLAAKGASAGTIASLLVLLAIGAVADGELSETLPQMDLNVLQIISLIALPALACMIAALASRFTVLRALSAMP